MLTWASVPVSIQWWCLVLVLAETTLRALFSGRTAERVSGTDARLWAYGVCVCVWEREREREEHAFQAEMLSLSHTHTHTLSLSLSLFVCRPDMWGSASKAQIHPHMSACMSYEEEDACMSYEEEDTCMSYEDRSIRTCQHTVTLFCWSAHFQTGEVCAIWEGEKYTLILGPWRLRFFVCQCVCVVYINLVYRGVSTCLM
jgi:hypothetical protein